MQNNISKIAAILYLDNNYEIKRCEIVNKYIEGAYISNQNQPITIEEIEILIESNFQVIISDSEIMDALNEYQNEYDSFSVSEFEKAYKLRDFIYTELKNITKENDLDKFINEYIINCCSENSNAKDISTLIWKFLFELFGRKISGFSHLIGKQIDYSGINIHDFDFNDDEKKVINDFLNYNNADKDRAIFNIACYALEYCLFVSNIDSSEFIKDELTKKSFYLDTNLLFRALGINGERRKQRTRMFLNKCVSTGQKLIITNNTLTEFKKSIEFHSSTLLLHKGKKVNYEIYKEHFTDGDIERFYYEWSNKKVNNNLNLFVSYTNTCLNEFIAEYSIQIDEYDYSIDDQFKKGFKDTFNKMSSDLSKDEMSLKHDSYDLQVISVKRNNYNKSLFDTEYFYISTDFNLKFWDDSISGYDKTPRIFFPDQWLTLIIKLTNRTTEDIKSFISFINLSQNHPLIDSRKFNRIIAGIVEITEDFNLQKEIVNSMIKSSLSVLHNKGLEEIERFSSNYAHDFITEKNANYEKEIDILKSNNDMANTKLSTLASSSHEKDTIIELKDDEIDKLSKELKTLKREKAEKDLLNKYKRSGILWILFLLFEIYLLFCIFKLIPLNYNLYYLLSNNFLNDNNVLGLMNGIVIAIYTVGTPVTLNRIYIYLFSKTKQNEFLKKNLNEI